MQINEIQKNSTYIRWQTGNVLILLLTMADDVSWDSFRLSDFLPLLCLRCNLCNIRLVCKRYVGNTSNKEKANVMSLVIVTFFNNEHKTALLLVAKAASVKKRYKGSNSSELVLLTSACDTSQLAREAALSRSLLHPRRAWDQSPSLSLWTFFLFFLFIITRARSIYLYS